MAIHKFDINYRDMLLPTLCFSRESNASSVKENIKLDVLGRKICNSLKSESVPERTSTDCLLSSKRRSIFNK